MSQSVHNIMRNMIHFLEKKRMFYFYFHIFIITYITIRCTTRLFRHCIKFAGSKLHKLYYKGKNPLHLYFLKGYIQNATDVDGIPFLAASHIFKKYRDFFLRDLLSWHEICQSIHCDILPQWAKLNPVPHSGKNL